MNVNNILITGATGNIGKQVVHYLLSSAIESKIIAAVRSRESFQRNFLNTKIEWRLFDFENPKLFSDAFDNIDTLFLLRPPQISDVDKVFRPLLRIAKEMGVQNVVFLSVQGAERISIIPHNKIERLIGEFGFNYIFVRPSYFMQNLTTTLLPEIVNSKRITLPSGRAKFNWVDVKNIGEAISKLIMNFDRYKYESFEITGSENIDFYGAAKIMTEVTGERIGFISINPIRFYFKKRREGFSSGFALVITILHFLPRLQGEPNISDNYKKLTGKEPTTLREFLERERSVLKKEQDQPRTP